VDHLFIVREGGNVKDFIGQYSEYREYMKEQEAEEARQLKAEAEKSAKNSKPAPVATPTRRKLSFKEQRELEQLEKDIAQLEEEKQQLEKQLSTGSLGHEELMAASARIAQIIEELDTKEMRWLELSEI
jgi:ATP-binding cassette subfamily F protein uup